MAYVIIVIIIIIIIIMFNEKTLKKIKCT